MTPCVSPLCNCTFAVECKTLCNFRCTWKQAAWNWEQVTVSHVTAWLMRNCFCYKCEWRLWRWETRATRKRHESLFLTFRTFNRVITWSFNINLTVLDVTEVARSYICAFKTPLAIIIILLTLHPVNTNFPTTIKTNLHISDKNILYRWSNAHYPRYFPTYTYNTTCKTYFYIAQ